MKDVNEVERYEAEQYRISSLKRSGVCLIFGPLGAAFNRGPRL